jgi:hypothetical protein
MFYTEKEYNTLKNKYGGYSSWAIWDEENPKNVSIISSSVSELKPNYIFIGLNISEQLKSESWINFHGGKHDRKLQAICNKTKLRGSYLTDLFKDVVAVNSSSLSKLSDEIIQKNVKFFNQEMKDIKIMENSVFVILGTESSLVSKYFVKYFLKYYKNKVINHYHYSYYGVSDEKWLIGLRNKIGFKNL